MMIANASRQLLQINIDRMGSMPRMGWFPPPPTPTPLSRANASQVNQSASGGNSSVGMTSVMENEEFPGLFVLNEGNQISLLTTKSVHKASSPIGNSPVGFIADARKPERALQFSTSAWTDENGASSSGRVLQNEKYTKLVETICLKMLKYPLPACKRGLLSSTEKHEGQLVSYHVEIKLAVWLIRQLVLKFLRTENMRCMHRLRGLKELQHRRFIIFVNDDSPCRSCQDVIGQLNNITGLQITIAFLNSVKRGGLGNQASKATSTEPTDGSIGPVDGEDAENGDAVVGDDDDGYDSAATEILPSDSDDEE